MAEAHRRYTFSPLERRGVLLGLQGGQAATLLAGVAGALLLSQVVPAPAGTGLALLVLVGVAAAAVWSRAGRPVACWLPVAAAWCCRRGRGAPLAPQPLTGSSLVATRTMSRPRARSGRDPCPDGIDLVEAEGGFGHEAVGVIHDRRCGALAAVVPVQGRSFVLLDVDEQIGQLESWRAVLGTLARPGTPLRRIQWVHCSAAIGGPADHDPSLDRSGLLPADRRGDTLRASGRSGALPSPADTSPGSPARAGGDSRWVAGGPGALPFVKDAASPGVGLAQDSYQQLVSEVGISTQAHRAWMVLAVGGSHRPGSQAERALNDLRRELRLLDGQLRNADLQAGPPLGLDDLRGMVAAAHRQERPGAGDRRRGRPWPMATDEAWGVFRADATWHATFWVAEWPRVEVNPDFLTPLLLCDGRRTVSVVMAPVPAERASREVRAARAADVADEELRTRAGFLPSARRRREADGVIQRESELAEGHVEYRFSGYVTVTATDREGLDAACVETEQVAQRSHLELRRLYGRQAEAFTWTLPLARGLA